MRNENCGDNRFEVIEKYKAKLIEAKNIEQCKDEMDVIDSILFRFWQMGWLDILEKQTPKKPIIHDAGYDQYKNVNLYRCDCPSCGEILIDYTDDDIPDDADGYDLIDDFYKAFDESILQTAKGFCSCCGQVIDWSKKND